jgi:hypothetical protein
MALRLEASTFYYIGVTDYLAVQSTVTGPVQQQLAQQYFATFYFDYFLFVATA